MKPILFNTDMVRAILDGRKTVTRRLVKGVENDWEFLQTEWNPAMTKVDKNGEEYSHEVEGFWATFEWDGLPEFPLIKARYQPGAILYVRETWAHPSEAEISAGADPGMFLYKADRVHPAAWGKWHPSIHMPQDAARLFLVVKDVRVERLQDITEDDVIAEGAEPLIGCDREHTVYYSESEAEPCWNHDPCKNCPCFRSYPELFGEYVWDETIKPKELAHYGWAANPWVWVIEFERISKEEA